MNASECPFCGSTDTWYDDGETDEREGVLYVLYEHMHCDGCGEDYTNVYTLTSQMSRFSPRGR